MKRFILTICITLWASHAMANCVSQEKLSDGGRKNVFIKWVIVNNCGQTIAIRDANTNAVLRWLGTGQKMIVPRNQWNWTWN